MKTLGKRLGCLILCLMMLGSYTSGRGDVEAATQYMMIYATSSTKVTYRKTRALYDKYGVMTGVGGYGAKKTMKYGKKPAIYILRTLQDTRTKKTNVAGLKKAIKRSRKWTRKSGGVTYTHALLARVTVKNGKIVKIVEIYEA